MKPKQDKLEALGYKKVSYKEYVRATMMTTERIFFDEESGKWTYTSYFPYKDERMVKQLGFDPTE